MHIVLPSLVRSVAGIMKQAKLVAYLSHNFPLSSTLREIMSGNNSESQIDKIKRSLSGKGCEGGQKEVLAG